MMRVTRKFLEAQVLRCAKSLGLAVVGIDAKRAAEFGVPVAKLVRKGELIPGHNEYADATGYYAPRSNPLGIPSSSLHIDASSPGDGWTRYRLVELRETGTGHYTFYGGDEGRTATEFSAFLRGIEAGAMYARDGR